MTMRGLTVNVRNGSVMGVDGLEKGQRFVCVDMVMLELSIGAEEAFRALYESKR